MITSAPAASDLRRRDGSSWNANEGPHLTPEVRAALRADGRDEHERAASSPPAASLRCYALHVIDWSSCSVVERDDERVSGAWVFQGTRVPVAALFENLEDGVSIQEFVELFPGVTLGLARAVLEHAARSAVTAA